MSRILSILTASVLFCAPAMAQNADMPQFLLNDPAFQNEQAAQEQADLLQTVPPVPGSALGVEKTEDELQAEAREEAFDAALQGLLPLKPDEIRRLLEHFDRTQEAVELPVYPSPRPEVAVETISLDPGQKPSMIKTAYGHVTTLSILDMSGKPWPIQDISWAGNFEVIEGSTEEGSHIVRISPQSEFARGNISMRLLKLQTPVILSIETSRDMVHYRFDAIIPDYGPMASAPLIDQGLTIQAGSASISSILRGVPPSDASRLTVDGVDGRTSAYKIGEQIYVRTPLTMLSPGWSASVSSADGMRVYEIPDTPVVLFSRQGKMVRARLSERSESFEEMINDR